MNPLRLNKFWATLNNWAKRAEPSADFFLQTGDELFNIGLFSLAKVCFESAVALTHETSHKQYAKIRVQEAKLARGRKKVTLEQEVVAKAFFRPLDRPSRRPKPDDAKPIPVPDAPLCSSLAGYAQWAKLKFQDILTDTRKIKKADCYLRVLRRFGSFTPLVDPSQRYAFGGGYLVACGGIGLAMDPGHNFIRNLLCAGYCLDDIDYVLVSHAHDDHMNDLVGLDSLFFKRWKCNDVWPRVPLLYWNAGANAYFKGSSLGKGKHFVKKDVLSYSRMGERPTITVKSDEQTTIEVSTLPANHPDCTGYNGVGLTVRLRQAHTDISTIVYSSDTGWSSELERAYIPYRGCTILLLHIGSIAPKEINVLNPSAKDADYLYENHLGLIGTTRLIEAVQPKKVLIGEFGEELAGMEEEVVKIFQGVFPHLEVAAARLYGKYDF
jgi:glyoxylase-like metal-dependent hydrolase (beta-lactamase superfamily II)